MSRYKHTFTLRVHTLFSIAGLGVCIFLWSLLPYSAALGNPADGFAPHKAIYNISLLNSKSSTQLVNASGQMLYEWQPSCEGWVSNHRFTLAYEYADAPTMEVNSDFSNFERFDGTRLDFVSQRKKAGAVFEEIRGHADKSDVKSDVASDVKSSQAIYQSPRGLVYDLPEGTLFPVNHTYALLKAAQDGKRFYKATVFDGSDEDGPVEINAFIGKEKPISEDQNWLVQKMASQDTFIDKSLITQESRKIQLAFFPLIGGGSEPEYEMSLFFQKNGIITDMIIAYDDFSIRQKLKALEPLIDQCK